MVEQSKIPDARPLNIEYLAKTTNDLLSYNTLPTIACGPKKSYQNSFSIVHQPKLNIYPIISGKKTHNNHATATLLPEIHTT